MKLSDPDLISYIRKLVFTQPCNYPNMLLLYPYAETKKHICVADVLFRIMIL